MKAGAVAFDITPPLGVPLAGSFDERIAVDIADPLYARAVVLEDEVGGRLAIVCCDLICMPGETVRLTREFVGKAGDVPPDRIFIAATHTHTAPAPNGLLGTRRAADYMDALPQRLATAIALAARRLRPARAAWGTGHEAGVSFNRRFRMRDGTVHMNPGRLNPDIVEPAGPIDPELGLLWIEGEDGAPVAVVSCFALHYVGTDHSRHVSADYFGAYARWLQRIFGPEVVPLLLNGASGDINNADVFAPHQLGGSIQARRVAGVLAGETLRVVQKLHPTGEITLDAASARLPFRRKAVTPEDLALAERILAVPEATPPEEIRRHAGLGDRGPFSWVVGQPLRPGVLRTYARECQILAELPEEMETEVQALRIGGCALVALPGEIFVELGLAIKARSPFGPGDAASVEGTQPNRTPEGRGVTLVASLANDYVGYVPTRRAQLEEGGYETWAARSALPAAGTGEAMVDVAVKLLDELQRVR
jgi:neutral ceramidase